MEIKIGTKTCKDSNFETNMYGNKRSVESVGKAFFRLCCYTTLITILFVFGCNQADTKGKIVQYKVEHLQENIENDIFTLQDIETKEGVAGKSTEATEKQYEGFVAQLFAQSIINADGSTVIQIKYKRRRVSIILNLDGGETETKLSKGENGNKLLRVSMVQE